MPWKESNKMNEKVKFVARLLDGERMSDLCKEFGISRKSGYAIKNKYEKNGSSSFYEQSRSAVRRPNQTSAEVTGLITELRETHKTWGAPKIKAYLEGKHPDKSIPAKSTIHKILCSKDLVKKKKRRRNSKMVGSDLSASSAPNDIWCTDYKGEFKIYKNYCYPITLTDHFSRYILGCDALENTKTPGAFDFFDRKFEEFGLPKVIKSDNGNPFGTNSIFGLSELCIWWLRLGIKLERIIPGHPEQNGRHERMHKTLKQEIILNPAKSFLNQQEIFDSFVDVFNQERPHQAIEMKTPGDLYIKSDNKYKRELAEILYDADRVSTVRNNGCIYVGKKRTVFVGCAFRGQPLGVKEIEDGLFNVLFMDKVIGIFDDEEFKLKPLENPFIVRG
jgi:transposase InsO family protein